MHTIGMSRAAVAVAAAALTTGGILATATVVTAAPPPKPHVTKLSISNKVVAHGRHHVDAVTGTLTSGRTGVADEPVALEARMGVTPRWKVVDTATTGTGGAVTFSLVTPKVKTQLKLVFAGTSSYRASHSDVITVSPVK